jgi:Tfp pilus assembly protein PilF
MRPFALAMLILCCALLQAQGAQTHSQQPSAASPRIGPMGSASSWFRTAEAAIAHGKRADAERMAITRGAADADAAVVLAQLDADRGKYQDARTRLEPIARRNPTGEAALELALVDRTIGRSADATPLLTGVMEAASTSSDAALLFRGARAAHALDRAHDAKNLYLAAEKAGGDAVPIETELGRLFREKDNAPEALKSFTLVLQSDPQWAPADAGLARLFEDEDPAKAADAASKAIAIDPGLADPHLLLASLDLDQDRNADAAAELNKVLAIDPPQLEAHALLAATAYVKDDKAGYDAEVNRVLQINPSYGEVYRITGEQAASHYRFQEAAALARKALQLDPSDTQAEADLGMHLLRIGDETGARDALERAFKADDFNVVTFNLLQMLDTLDKFVTIKDGDFVFKMDPSEAPVLRDYAIPLAHDAMKTLAARYGFTPTGPILVEIFPNHDDFAVRNLGLPGMIGVLGACFGNVVTLDSPHARNTPGAFNWQATLWHELTHVVTLGMSNQRIPRWLTEGISVYEEGRERPEWGRDMEVTFARALDRGKVLKLRDLNAGFTRPDTIGLAYYEASLLVDHIVATRGQAALNRLVRSFADGLDTDQALQKTLNVSMADLQISFDRALEERFGAAARALHDADKPVSSSVDDLRTAAAAHPDSFMAQLALGEALATAGDPAAYAPLQRASALVPQAIGPESPHAIMAALADKLGDHARTMKEDEAILKADHTNVEAARTLADLAKSAGDDRMRAFALERIVSIDPFDPAAHTAWGQIAMKEQNAVLAAREFHAAIESGAPDKAAAYCDLADAYLAAGRRDDAKKEVLAAIEIAPSYERAQDLLLRIKG